MGCGNCGSAANGKPLGCKSNGGCSTGGCNRLNVFDWLNGLPLSDSSKPYSIVELSFNKGSRKEFFRNGTNHLFEKGDWVTVEGVGGIDIGQISLMGELVKLQMKKYSVTDFSITKRILHPSTEEEIAMGNLQKEREPEVLIRSRAMAKTLNLDMKLCEVEIQADSKKGTFFYTADQRVDFRELIKIFASEFKMKVEMKQIGARQESAKVGGIGSCGRELCCSTWLTDFKSVNTTAARYQNLSINQTKLSGQCGRLKCCLNYELDTYMDALSVFPDDADTLEIEKGVATLQKRDIFKNLMWYSFTENNKQYPLTIERAKEIRKLNKAGQKAAELLPVEIETREMKSGVVPDAGYINDVGQINLKSLDQGNKNKKQQGNKNTQQAGQHTGIGKEGNTSQQQNKNQPIAKGNNAQKKSENLPTKQPQPQKQIQPHKPQPQQNKPAGAAQTGVDKTPKPHPNANPNKAPNPNQLNRPQAHSNPDASQNPVKTPQPNLNPRPNPKPPQPQQPIPNPRQQTVEPRPRSRSRKQGTSNDNNEEVKEGV